MPFIETSHINVYYEKRGNGEPLIFLHGLGNNSQSFSHQLEGLADNFTVIAWDAPGYGKSSDQAQLYKNFSEFSDVLYEFVEGLQLDTFNLLGHSMGAAIAVDFTHRFGHKVNKLILADPTRGAANLTPEQNERNLKNRVTAVDELTGEQLAERRVPNLLAENAPEEVVNRAKQIMAQVRPSGYKSVAHSLYNLNQMDIYPQIKHETLIICGEEDRVTPVSESETVHERIKHSELVIIPEAGHLCYQEKPQLFNEAIIKFLQE